MRTRPVPGTRTCPVATEPHADRAFAKRTCPRERRPGARHRDVALRDVSRCEMIPAMSGYDGGSVQNAIYIAGHAEWPIRPEDWEAAAKAKLDAGAFDYIAGGAGGEATRARTSRRSSGGGSARGCSAGDRLARPLGRGARHARRLRRCSSHRSAGSRPRTRTARSPSRARPPPPDVPIVLSSASTSTDRGGRGDDGRRDALVPALLGQRPRRRRELRRARPGGGLLRDRRHDRHRHRSRWRPRDLAQRVPPVPPRRGLRATSSPTPRSSRSSTRRRRRTRSRRRRRCSRRSRTSG